MLSTSFCGTISAFFTYFSNCQHSSRFEISLTLLKNSLRALLGDSLTLVVDQANKIEDMDRDSDSGQLLAREGQDSSRDFVEAIEEHGPISFGNLNRRSDRSHLSLKRIRVDVSTAFRR